jgi:hypothetical protein
VVRRRCPERVECAIDADAIGRSRRLLVMWRALDFKMQQTTSVQLGRMVSVAAPDPHGWLAPWSQA